MDLIPGLLHGNCDNKMSGYGRKPALATYFMISLAVEQLTETHVPYYDKMTFKGPFQHQQF